MERHAFVLDADDACLDGHFPDRPIIPGVVLIDAAMNAFGLKSPIRIEQAKFLRPCVPGMPLELVKTQTATAIDLRVECAGELMASVRLLRHDITEPVTGDV